jgi:hypothetical protein
MDVIDERVDQALGQLREPVIERLRAELASRGEGASFEGWRVWLTIAEVARERQAAVH